MKYVLPSLPCPPLPPLPFPSLSKPTYHLIYLTPPHSSFLKHTLPRFAASHPQIEITVSPRPHKHPVIKGTYINGREKAVCVRNLEKEQILLKAELLRDANGEKLKKVTKPVRSGNESVRGVWSPYHGVVQHV